MTKKACYILIIALIVVTMVGIVIGVCNDISEDKLSKQKTIVLNEQTQTEMEVNLSGICPSMTVSYKINLKANKGDSFDITMDFEKTDTDSLAPFVDVEIRLKDESLDSAKLSEYLEGRQITFPAKFDSDAEIDIEIVYSMGLDVGDEAQNTTADFNIVLFAER